MENIKYSCGKLVYGTGSMESVNFSELMNKLKNNVEITDVTIIGEGLLVNSNELLNIIGNSGCVCLSSCVLDRVEICDVNCNFKISSNTVDEVITALEYINKIEVLTEENIITNIFRLSCKSLKIMEEFYEAYNAAEYVVEKTLAKSNEMLSDLDKDIVDEYNRNLYVPYNLPLSIIQVCYGEEYRDLIDNVKEFLQLLPVDVEDVLKEDVKQRCKGKYTDKYLEIAECLLGYVAPKGVEIINTLGFDFSRVSNLSRYVDRSYVYSEDVLKTMDNGDIDVNDITDLCINYRANKLKSYLTTTAS